MILTALATHVPQEGSIPLGYARKATLGFELTITEAGGGCRLLDCHVQDDSGKRWRPKEACVPDMTRSNNPPPLLGCDNAAFVLGRPKPGNDAGDAVAAALKKQAAFVQQLRDYRVESGDADVEPYIRWVEQGMPGLDEQVAALPAHASKRLDLDLIAIAVEGASRFLHDNPSAMEYWARRSLAAKSGSDEKVCLVCGGVGPVVDTFPQALAGRFIPGTDTAQVALVSANFAASMRSGSGAGLKSVPICAPCAGRAVAAFNDLASSSVHSVRLSDSSAAIWWSSDSGAARLVALLDGAVPQQVRELFDSVHGGGRPASPVGEFYFLVYSGNVARLVVRRWFTLDLGGFEENILRWFTDVEVPDERHPFRTPSAMAKSLGAFPLGERGETSPDGVFAAFLLAALTGEPPPLEYLRVAISRTIAEVHRIDHDAGWQARQRAMDRLAVIRLIINRTATGKEHIMTTQLDESRNDPAYLSGRVFALSQGLQRAALGDVNASIVDRYFARAIQHPASVDSALAILQMQHAASLQRKGSGGLAHSYQKRIGELRSRMGDAPGRLGIREQAAWIAGYFQQREASFHASASADRPTNSDARDGADHETKEG